MTFCKEVTMQLGLKVHVEVRDMKTVAQQMGGRNWKYRVVRLGFSAKHEKQYYLKQYIINCRVTTKKF